LPSSLKHFENQYVWAVCRNREIVKYKPYCYVTLLNTPILSSFSYALEKYSCMEFQQTSSNLSNMVDHYGKEDLFKAKCWQYQDRLHVKRKKKGLEPLNV